MGGCCYSPSIRQLLWWHWLLLFSIVGIPMLLAALYVQNVARREKLETKHVQMASWIFWFGTLLCSVALICGAVGVSHLYLGAVTGVTLFIVSYVLWFAVALTGTKRAARYNRTTTKIAVLGGFFLVGVVLANAPLPVLYRGWPGITWVVGAAAIGILKFAVCMLPARYWQRFSVSPSRAGAWVFLLALLGSTCLFWVVSQYGRLLLLAAHALLTGELLR